MTPYLKISIDFGPTILERLVALIPPSRYDESLGEDRFTVREVIAHLADWEPIFRSRIEQAIQEPGTWIRTFDEGQRSIDLNYAATDIHVSLATLKRERAETSKLIRALPKEEFAKTLEHPEQGTISLDDIANMQMGHDLYHIEQLTEYLAEKVAGTW